MTDPKNLYIRVPEDLWRQIHEAAKAQDRTMASWVRELIRAELKRLDQPA